MEKVVNNKSVSNQLTSLVLLRCIAVVMVCLCHFAFPLASDKSFFGLFKLFEKYGPYGVHIFFVISGFIIPFSLFRGNYCLRDYPQFLYKRILRLHPAYLAALALTLIVMYLSYGARHVPFPETITTILQSIFYLHIPPDNPVFWTLLVEGQYYIFIGVFYLLLMNNARIAYFIVIPILLLLCHTVFTPYLLIAHYLAFFLLGNVGYMIYTGNGEKIANFIAMTGIIVFIAFFYEVPALLFATSTLLFILLFKKPISAVPTFIGKISYSIYLIHFPLGVKLINFMKSRINPGYNWLLFSVTLVLIIAVSWVFYKIFEEFSERLSKKVKYKPALVPTDSPMALV